MMAASSGVAQECPIGGILVEIGVGSTVEEEITVSSELTVMYTMAVDVSPAPSMTSRKMKLNS
jgi:hypothetical protein